VNILPSAIFEVILLDENNQKKQEVVESWQELGDYLADYHLKIPLLVVQGVILTRDAMNFFRSVDPICFSGEVHFKQIDFSPFAGLFHELFDVIFKSADIVQFVSPHGIRGFSLSGALCTCEGLRRANLVRISKEEDSENEVVSGYKMDLDGICEYLHNKEALQCRTFVVDADFLRVSVNEVWNKLVKIFLGDKKKAPFMLEILCSKKLEKLLEVNYSNTATNERLSIVVYPHPVKGKPLLAGGHRVVIRRYE